MTEHSLEDRTEEPIWENPSGRRRRAGRVPGWVWVLAAFLLPLIGLLLALLAPGQGDPFLYSY